MEWMVIAAAPNITCSNATPSHFYLRSQRANTQDLRIIHLCGTWHFFSFKFISARRWPGPPPQDWTGYECAGGSLTARVGLAETRALRPVLTRTDPPQLRVSPGAVGIGRIALGWPAGPTRADPARTRWRAPVGLGSGARRTRAGIALQWPGWSLEHRSSVVARASLPSGREPAPRGH